MFGSGHKKLIQKLLAIGGISINGDKDYDIHVHDDRFYKRTVMNGSLGFGESYMEGWWDTKKIDELFYRILKSGLNLRLNSWVKIVSDIESAVFNIQNRIGSKLVVNKHYNLGNELYMSFLDPYNQYTCGYFENTRNLDVAQIKKLELICKKLDLKKEDKVLDIGCGWGGFVRYAAETIGCHVTGISISNEQLKYARDFTKKLPVSLHHMDYRDLKQKFDKILVCGMIEHVGVKNYRKLMEVIHQSLNQSGRFLLQTIGSNTSIRSTDPWISKYIFPNSLLPSANQITKATEGLFVMEDWQNFGTYYDKTLMSWHNNFDANWQNIKSKYDDRFYRMWKYYLLSSAGSFRARDNQLWQIVYSPKGQPGVYQYLRP